MRNLLPAVLTHGPASDETSRAEASGLGGQIEGAGGVAVAGCFAGMSLALYPTAGADENSVSRRRARGAKEGLEALGALRLRCRAREAGGRASDPSSH
jgi:hypothetical protein